MSDAHLEAAKNTLIIQGYVASGDGTVGLTEDGFLALICLWALVPPEDMARLLTGQALTDMQEGGQNDE